MINIYRQVDSVETPICSVSDENATIGRALMGKDELIVDVTVDKVLPVWVNDYIYFDGDLYRLNREPEFSKKSDVEYEYKLVFEGYIYELLDKLYVYTLTNQSKFYLTGTLRDFLELLLENINELHPGWTLGYIVETERKNILFESLSCREVLNHLASEFGMEYYLNKRELNFTERIGFMTDLVFEQGKGKGLYTIEQNNIDSGNTVTRAFLYGGTKNLPPARPATETEPARPPYRNGEERLRIEERYIEDTSEYDKIVERDVFFDEIYPKFKGTVKSVEGDYNRIIHCSEIDFDITKFLIGGTAAKINFLTGDFTGESFEFNPTQNSSGYSTTINLVRKEDETALPDAEGKRPLIPNDNRKIQPGDKFNFTDIIMPDAYVVRAENELRVKGREWLDYYKQLRVKFSINIDYRYLRRNGYNVSIGDVIKLSIPQRGIVNKQLRVSSLERNLHTDKISCEVSNYIIESWEKKIQAQIQDAKNSIDVAMSEFNFSVEATKDWVTRFFARLAGKMEDGQAIVWDELLKVIKTVETVPDALKWAGHLFPDMMDQAVKTDSDVIHNSVTAKSLAEEDNPDNEEVASTRLKETDGGYLGDMNNVEDEANTAMKGSMLIKDQDTWVPVYPTYSSTPSYDNLLMPVFNTLTKQWLYITVPSGGVVPPVTTGFPYTFPLILS